MSQHLEALWPLAVIAALVALGLLWLSAHPCVRRAQVPCYADWRTAEPPVLCWACVERE